MDRRTFLIGAGAVAGSFAPGGSILRHRPDAASVAGGGSAPSFRYLELDPQFVYSRPCFAQDRERVLFMRAPATADPIAVLNSDSSPWDLWTVALDGTDARPFFEDPSLNATRPAWCPATGRIAFTGIRGAQAGLWLVDDDGSNLTHVPVPSRTRLFYPSWYPLGDAIAVTDYATREILRIEPASGEVEVLTDPDVVWAGMCAVSPDSARGNPVAFAGQPPGEHYDARRNRIWIRHADREPFLLHADQGRTPSWSPAGDRLAFSSERRRPAPTFTLHPRTLPAGAGSVFIQEFDAFGQPADGAIDVGPYDVITIHPKWAPDGATLVCMAWDVAGPRRGLAIIDLEA